MSLRLHKGLWTIFSREQPVMSFASFDAGVDALDDLLREAA